MMARRRWTGRSRHDPAQIDITANMQSLTRPNVIASGGQLGPQLAARTSTEPILALLRDLHPPWMLSLA